MSVIQPKKSLGQHFLRDDNIARKIVEHIKQGKSRRILEIGPGTGVLTQFLCKIPDIDLKVVEIDRHSVEYLRKNFNDLKGKIIHEDFLDMDPGKIFEADFSIIGNFPYNISSQIFFKILDAKEKIDQVVCMVQREVAQRISAASGNKTYGILSVLLQAFFQVEYLFTVNETVFTPPPKVKSAVIKLCRKEKYKLQCDHDLFFKIVKLSFNQRRKILKNSLKSILLNLETKEDIFFKRPEQLSVDQFIELTEIVSKANLIKGNS